MISLPQKSGFSTIFLKFVLCLIAIGAFITLIKFPQTEGRAANLDLIQIYTDPFIIYMYIASVPFFIALYQIFKLLGFVEKNKTTSQASMNILKNIKYCALAFMAFIAVAISYIFVMSKVTNEDGAGAIMVGLIIIVISAIVAAAADYFKKFD